MRPEPKYKEGDLVIIDRKGLMESKYSIVDTKRYLELEGKTGMVTGVNHHGRYYYRVAFTRADKICVIDEVIKPIGFKGKIKRIKQQKESVGKFKW